MKIKGRLIATLAALGLLIAMLPIGPASAAVGTVVLTGGAGNGAFFSDKDTKNIVTIEVTGRGPHACSPRNSAFEDCRE